MCSDAWSGSRQTQSRPAGAVAFKEAESTNPEIFRRGWGSAGPPSPELPPNLDDGEGQTATAGFQGVGHWMDSPMRRDENQDSKANVRPRPTAGAQVRGALNGSVPASQIADYGYAHVKATFDTPICGQSAKTDDGYAPGRAHGVAYGDQPRRRTHDMTTNYAYDAHAAKHDARLRADDDVESGYVPGRVSNGYKLSLIHI